MDCAPHFEKMLYDNSQLARVYLHAWILTSERGQAVTGNDFFLTITEEILDYVMREMTYFGSSANDQQLRPEPQLPSNANGVAGFYSTQDADSEGVEGKCFVWAPDEVHNVLGEEAGAFIATFGFTPGGNASTGSAHGFEGKNIVGFVGDTDQRPTLVKAWRSLRVSRFRLPGAYCGAGGTAGAARAPMILWSIEHATRASRHGLTAGFRHAAAFAVVSVSFESFYGSYSSTGL